MSSFRKTIRATCAILLFAFETCAHAANISASPSDYLTKLANLKAGDILDLSTI
jgi:hypothetical protein